MDILYIAPCGRRLRTFPEIQRYLELKEVKDLNIDHFTFSRKVDVGEVWEGDKVRREGGEEGKEGRREGGMGGGREGERKAMEVRNVILLIVLEGKREERREERLVGGTTMVRL